ncbi:50S ribosomal protein L18 [Candidatus Woesearchaeota archaeon]|nr:50S ribosomal protein L18 [Candidatus Woesearchaeota archaeon]
MKKNKIAILPFRRKLQGKTNYRQRIKLLSSRKPRLVVRKALKNIVAQIVEYEPVGDRVIASASSAELKKLNWRITCGNIPSAYLVGLLLGKKAKKNNVVDAVLDIGLQKSVKGSRLYAVLKGVVDAGINVPHSKEILPTSERISGMHIAKYAKEIENDGEKFNKFFGAYVKNNINPGDIPKLFEETRKKILGA